MILITFSIYIRAGTEIYRKHKQLREFSTSFNDQDPLNPLEDLFGSTKTTEVFVTTEVADTRAIDLRPLGASAGGKAQNQDPQLPQAAYSVTISSSRNREAHGEAGLPVQTHITTGSQAGAQGSAATATTTTAAASANRLRRRAAYEASNATWSYTKCAILFFTALLVTWLPSSANRVYSLAHTKSASLPLEYMSAFVLPLQGFWNSIIYVVTSWSACKLMWQDLSSWWPCGGGRRRGARKRGSGGRAGKGLPDAQEPSHHRPRSAFQMMGSGRGGVRSGDGKAYENETESTTELAGSRPGSSSCPTTTTVMSSVTMDRAKVLEG